MSIRIWTGPALLLGLAACSSNNSPQVMVQNTDPASLKASPAGVATTVFADLETIRPDNLAQAGSPNSGITVTSSSPSSFTYTFTNCKAANGGALTGTVFVTTSGTGPTTNIAVYDLHVLDTAGGAWRYFGTKVVTVDLAAKTAAIAVPPGQTMTVEYQNSADTAKNRTWTYTPDLHADWSNANAITFWGTYAFQQTQPAGSTVTVTIPQATALTWTPDCTTYPTSGIMTLSLPPSSAEIRFNNSITDPSVQHGCGVITINGYALRLGQ